MNQNRFVVHDCVLEVCRLLMLLRKKEVGLDSGINSQGPWDEKLEQDFFCLVWLKQMRPYLYNTLKVGSCYLATPFVWPSCTSLCYFQAAFIAQIFFHISSTFQSFVCYWTKGWIGHLFCSCSSILSQDKKSLLHLADVVLWGRAWVLMQTEGCPSHMHLISCVILIVLLLKELLRLGMGAPWGLFSAGLSLLVLWLQVRRFGFLLLSVDWDLKHTFNK